MVSVGVLSEDLCRICGKPVVAPSVGGPDVCPWCDMGMWRDGTSWTFREAMKMIGTNANPAEAHALASEHHDKSSDE
jgi:hypothetical protein